MSETGGFDNPTPNVFGGPPPPPPSLPLQPAEAPADVEFVVSPDSQSDGAAANEVVSERPRGGIGKKVAIGVGILAVVAAGGFAATKVFANKGGAATPQDAVQSLLNAASNEDLLGVMDVMLPGERDTFRQPMIDITTELGRLEVLDTQFDLAKLQGVDIEFTLDEATTENVAPDIANVTWNGTSSVSIDGENVPLGDFVTDLLGDADLGVEQDEQEMTDAVVTTVKHDGRWYVSLLYSVAETARLDAGFDEAPTVDDALLAVGGKTPEAAMDSMLEAVETLDLELMLTGLNPQEASALHRYAPLFLDDAQSSANDVLEQSGATISLADTEYTVTEIDKNHVGIVPKALVIDISIPDFGDAHIELADGCIVAEIPDQNPFNSCTVGAEADGFTAIEELFGADLAKEFQEFSATTSEAFADFATEGVVMTKVDGEWFVSPIGAITGVLTDVLRALDRTEVEELQTGIGSLLAGYQEAIEQQFEDSLEEEDGFESEESALDVCFGQSSDFDGLRACALQGIEDGTINEFEAGAIIIHDCGLGAPYFNGDIYSMADDEFIALVTDARSCFLDAGVTDDEMPLETSNIDCYNGVNVFASDDSTATDEFFDCAFG